MLLVCRISLQLYIEFLCNFAWVFWHFIGLYPSVLIAFGRVQFSPTSNSAGSSTGDTEYCYGLHHMSRSWQQARDFCNGSLLTIRSEEELTFIKTEILKQNPETSIIWLSAAKLAPGEPLFAYPFYYSTSDKFNLHCY